PATSICVTVRCRRWTLPAEGARHVRSPTVAVWAHGPGERSRGPIRRLGDGRSQPLGAGRMAMALIGGSGSGGSTLPVRVSTTAGAPELLATSRRSLSGENARRDPVLPEIALELMATAGVRTCPVLRLINWRARPWCEAF